MNTQTPSRTRPGTALGFNSSYFILFTSRPRDVASLWATILIAEVVGFLVLAYASRERKCVGSVRVRTIASCVCPM